MKIYIKRLFDLIEILKKEGKKKLNKVFFPTRNLILGNSHLHSPIISRGWGLNRNHLARDNHVIVHTDIAIDFPNASSELGILVRWGRYHGNDVDLWAHPFLLTFGGGFSYSLQSLHLLQGLGIKEATIYFDSLNAMHMIEKWEVHNNILGWEIWTSDLVEITC